MTYKKKLNLGTKSVKSAAKVEAKVTASSIDTSVNTQNVQEGSSSENIGGDEDYEVANIKQVLAMSPEEVAASLRDLTMTFSGENIDFLRKRGEKSMQKNTVDVNEWGYSATNLASPAFPGNADVPPSNLVELKRVQKGAPKAHRATFAWALDNEQEQDAPVHGRNANISSRHEGVNRSNDLEDTTVVRPKRTPNLQRTVKDSNSPAPASSVFADSERFDLTGRKIFTSIVLLKNDLSMILFGHSMSSSTAVQSSGSWTLCPLVSAETRGSFVNSLVECMIKSKFVTIIDSSHDANSNVDKVDKQWSHRELYNHEKNQDVPGYNLVEISEVRYDVLFLLMVTVMYVCGICIRCIVISVLCSRTAIVGGSDVNWYPAQKGCSSVNRSL